MQHLKTQAPGQSVAMEGATVLRRVAQPHYCKVDATSGQV